MDSIRKLLNKINKKDESRILKVMEQIQQGKLRGIKLSGKNQYRIRIGNYRIKYSLENGKQVINEIRRRNENTYKD